MKNRHAHARQALLAAAMASALSLATHTASAAGQEADDDYIDCKGVNACKGLSDCNRSACRGRNACKGQGFKIMGVRECLKAQAAAKAEADKKEARKP